MQRFTRLTTAALCVCLGAAVRAQSTHIDPWPREPEAVNVPRPAPAPPAIAELVGAYGPESDPVYVLEHDGQLFAIRGHGAPQALSTGDFTRDASGIGRVLTLAGAKYSRLPLGPAAGSAQLRVEPVRPVPAVLAEAATQQPPAESGVFRPSDLVELVTVDPSIKLGSQKWYTVRYTGWTADGTKFDSSYDHPGGEPITFPYGARRVIIGWDTGFEDMHVGGKRRLFIPYQLAYGETGRPPVIPAKADLIFDIELVSMSDTPPEPPAPAPAAAAQPDTEAAPAEAPAEETKPASTPDTQTATPAHPEGI